MTTTKAPVANCSFCQKPDTAVATLIAGAGVYICDECVGLCAQLLEAKPADRPVAIQMNDHLSADELLGLLPGAAAAGSQVERNLREWVRRLRAFGVTWARIGEALNMTRQSAWERFSGEQ